MSDETQEPLTRYAIHTTPRGSCWLQPVDGGPEQHHNPYVVIADEAYARIAELEAKLKEQSAEMEELHRFHRTGKWMADVQPDSDPPVTRRELAAVMSASRGPWTTDSIVMLLRLERGEDARGSD